MGDMRGRGPLRRAILNRGYPSVAEWCRYRHLNPSNVAAFMRGERDTPIVKRIILYDTAWTEEELEGAREVEKALHEYRVERRRQRRPPTV